MSIVFTNQLFLRNILNVFVLLFQNTFIMLQQWLLKQGEEIYFNSV